MIPNLQHLQNVLYWRITPDRAKPTHLPDQYEKMQTALAGDDPAWVLLLDAGRYDIFDQLVWDYFDGNLTRVWNGGIGYTGDWFERNASQNYPNAGLYNYMPLRFQDADYDGTQHFAEAPDIGHKHEVQKRLAQLGYAEKIDGAEVNYVREKVINTAVRESDYNGGVARYFKPHPPFVGMESLTSGSGKAKRTNQALRNGDITYQELTDAYIETYKMGLKAIQDLVPDITGRVYITTDHGTCLTCGQLFHARNRAMHDHLTVVPWFEVDRAL